MDITEVRVKLVDGGRHEKLKAFCSITIDDAFVVRDLKIIEGSRGLFVAMPSRKLTVRCPKCSSKNRVRSNYCAECGGSMPPDRARRTEGRTKLHADIAHPINTECRETLQARVIEDFLAECDASEQPGYEPQGYDEYDDSDFGPAEELEPVLAVGDQDSDEETIDASASVPAQRAEDGTTNGQRSRSRRRTRGGRGRGRRGSESGANGDGGRTEGTPVRSGQDRRPERSADRDAGTRDASTRDPGTRQRVPSDETSEHASEEGRSRRGRRGRGRGDGNGTTDAPTPRRESGGRGAAPKFDVSRKREKVVESSDPPPDDNFDVGIF